MRDLGPDTRDVAALTGLLDLMADFPSNEQRARYLLSCDWFTREGVAVATRAAIKHAAFMAKFPSDQSRAQGEGQALP